MSFMPVFEPLAAITGLIQMMALIMVPMAPSMRTIRWPSRRFNSRTLFDSMLTLKIAHYLEAKLTGPAKACKLKINIS